MTILERQNAESHEWRKSTSGVIDWWSWVCARCGVVRVLSGKDNHPRHVLDLPDCGTEVVKAVIES